MAMPALHALRSAKPQARLVAITMLTGSRDILHDSPCLDEVICFDFQRAGLVQSFCFILGLRRRRFDAVIATYPSNRLEYNVIQTLLGAKKTVGHRYRHRALRCANFLKNTAVMEDDALSNIEENRRLVEALTGKVAALALR
ncbi:MAG: glycosyltransferase family 9 protein [Candidatus Competibacteraceae bacterium]|nr:glycosyltransferase family 9 protein [Candidatus Competibacteraceae bacterium]